MILQEAKELLSQGKELNIKIELLTDEEAQKYINKVLQLFTPFKISGHLGIGHDSFNLPLDQWEFSYVKYLCKESGYIFFEQRNNLNKKTVLKIENVQLLGEILETSFGMEYFLTNERTDFLIAVNWYAIEVSGTAQNRLKRLL